MTPSNGSRKGRGGGGLLEAGPTVLSSLSALHRRELPPRTMPDQLSSARAYNRIALDTQGLPPPPQHLIPHSGKRNRAAKTLTSHLIDPSRRSRQRTIGLADRRAQGDPPWTQRNIRMGLSSVTVSSPPNSGFSSQNERRIGQDSPMRPLVLSWSCIGRLPASGTAMRARCREARPRLRS